MNSIIRTFPAIAQKLSLPILVAASLAACGQDGEPAADALPETPAAGAPAASLGVKTLRKGYGKAAEAGDEVTVHYTGWLYDETAENNRGNQFDSSVERGQKFHFPLGAGRVIKGWDQGVEGMLVGETREIVIPPQLAYGERGAGNVIPPGATLVFEVELFGAQAPGAAD